METAPAIVPQRAYPGFWQAVLLAGEVLLLQMLFVLELMPIERWAHFSILSHPLGIALISINSIGLILVQGFLTAKAPLAELYPLRRITFYLAVAVVLATLGLQILESDLDNLLRYLMPMEPGLARAFMQLTRGDQPLWTVVFTIVVVAPVTEELMFRGLILRGFLRRYAPWKAILASAVLFGLLHANRWQFPGATLMGCLAGWLVLRTGSLVPGLIMHALGNSLAVERLNFLPAIPGYNVGDLLSPVQFQPLWLNLTGAVLLVVGVGFAYRLTYPAITPAASLPASPTSISEDDHL